MTRPHNNVAISVRNVSKSFRLPHERHQSIKSALINFRHKRGYEKQRVLEDVSFEIKKGEFFGIVGRNGSGKSTLLKLLAGIYTPDKGSIHINGKLTPFIELGVGFNPELTGRENVFLNGALLGFNRKEMELMYDDIVTFAELERFMDQKLKNYSSGMQVRLAFSIAIRANSDILVLDEVLAVGDAAFQAKCNDYFDRLKRDKRTIVLVTHDMGSVEKYCDRALLIHNGDVKLIGSPSDVAGQYLLDNADPNREEKAAEEAPRELTSFVKSLSVKLASPARLKPSDTLRLDIGYEMNEDVPVYLGIALKYMGAPILEHNSKSIDIGHVPGSAYRVRYDLPLDKFNTAADIEVDVALFRKGNGQMLGYKLGSTGFTVKSGEKLTGGPIASDGVWSSDRG